MNGDSKWVSTLVDLSKAQVGVVKIGEVKTHFSLDVFSHGLQVLSELQSSPRQKACYDAWCAYGRMVNYDHKAVEATNADQVKVMQRGLVGCGWARCPMFGIQTSAPLYLCMACHGILYCGWFCQGKVSYCE